MKSLQDLIARRTQLKAELTQVEVAIAAFGSREAVKIRTLKNFRNTWGLTVDLENPRGEMVVFKDQNFSGPADQSDHDGWVVRSDWEQFVLDNPDILEMVWEVV